jgi:translocation and assembly module TamB
MPGEHRLQLTLQADDASASASLTGRLDEPWEQTRIWRFELDSARLEYGQLPAWQLVDGAAGLVSPERVEVGRHCWQAEEADLCLEAASDSEQLTASAELSGLGAMHFGPLLGEDLEIDGSVNGSMSLARAVGGPVTAQIDLETTAGRVVLPAYADADLIAGHGPPMVAFEPSRLTLALDPQEFRVAAAVNLQHGRLRLDASTPAAVVVDGELTPEARAAQPVTGSLELAVPDLAFVDRMLPAVARTEGAIDGRLELGGTLGEPVSTGRLTLRDGAATAVAPRIRITDVTVTLEGRERQGFAFDAVATSGPGQVRAAGSLQLLADAPVAQIDVQGADFQILNTDDARIYASPTLRVEAGQERVAVSGVVEVPRAEITPGARTAGAVTVSRDQVLEDEEPEIDVTPREFYADIRLIPGDEVYFSGFGLDARIEGDLRLVEAPGLPVRATGELRIVDGEYAAYGQQLEIARGRLFFAGPVTEPALDIEAVRRPRPGILVGARVEGPLADPQFSVFSDPPMSEQEQLAFLVLGRPLDEAPGGEGSALTQAALALGLRGGDALAQNIGERLGVDELAIVTDGDEEGAEGDPTQASLVVGTYLSPRLYVSYGVGLFQPGSVLQVQYDISRRWRLVTRSGGAAAGADLLFTLERGD